MGSKTRLVGLEVLRTGQGDTEKCLMRSTGESCCLDCDHLGFSEEWWEDIFPLVPFLPLVSDNKAIVVGMACTSWPLFLLFVFLVRSEAPKAQRYFGEITIYCPHSSPVSALLCSQWLLFTQKAQMFIAPVDDRCRPVVCAVAQLYLSL